MPLSYNAYSVNVRKKSSSSIPLLLKSFSNIVNYDKNVSLIFIGDGELKQELFNLRFQAEVGKLENTAQLKKVKKEIARCYTVLTERENTK